MARNASEDGEGVMPPTASPFAASLSGVSDSTLESITELILEAQGGQADAWDRIYALLYNDLHQIARSQIRHQQRWGQGSPTSLVNETWLRLAGAKFTVEGRSHLVALIARTMRFVLLDEARRALSEKQGGGVDVLPLDEVREPSQYSQLEQLLILDQALNDLAKLDARLAQVVELRYFGGLSEVEIAEVLGVTERTVRRDWRKARAFLFSHLSGGDNQGSGSLDT
ncbi:ECF-type sigma factor [Lysobacter niastensis]|nr:ECF-type sigma factor [Lysobacter niastensis]